MAVTRRIAHSRAVHDEARRLLSVAAMLDPRRLALTILVPLMTATLGCTNTVVSVKRTSLTPIPEHDAISARGQFEASDAAVTGRLSLEGKCYERAVERVETVEREEPSKGWNWTAIALGVAAGVGAGYAAVEAKNDPPECKGDTSQSYNADGTRKKQASCARTAAGWAGLTSAILIGTGVAGLNYPANVKRRSSEVVKSPTRTERDCGRGADTWSKVTLALHLSGVPQIPSKPDAEGRVTFALPSLDESSIKDVRVGLASVEVAESSTGIDALRPGTVLGTVSVDGWLAKERQRVGAAERARIVEADTQVFTGTVRGDDEAKSAFSRVCTPTGEEVCFDGLDNDCDGVVDNACGYAPGALQWTLTWGTGDDLDLHAIGPDGRHVFFGQRRGGASRLALDVDCRGQFGGGCLAGNVENIFTPRDQRPVEGTYRAWVEVFQALDGPPDRVIQAMLGGRLGGKSYRIPLRLVAQRGVRTFFAFAIGADGDKDAVIDREDACPTEEGPWSDDLTQRGCPDRDFDGVADKDDACPDEAGLKQPDPRQNGCARRFGKARLTARGVEIDGTVEFDSGSAVIRGASFGLLHDVAQAMAAGAFRRVLIEGHTDDAGDRRKNLILSRDRARAVVNHLVAREHVQPGTLMFAFFGPDRPRADNSTPQGKARNRRVEFKVLEAEHVTLTRW